MDPPDVTSSAAPLERVWFITGTSTGFGRALANAVLERGDACAATARQPDAIRDLEQRFGSRAKIMTLDVTDAAQTRKAVDEAVATFGRLDVVVNNAGYGLLGAIEELSDAEIRAQFETNVFGVLNVTKAALPHLRRQRSGHLLQISSVGGQVAGAGLGAYQATKFAVEGLSEALAKELIPLGIKVTIIEPGAFRTDWAGRSMPRAEPLEDYAETAGATRGRLERANGRQPGDPARAAQVMIEVVEAAEPPLRLPLGADAFASIRQKLQTQRDELDRWESVGTATAFTEG
jgi:NAD(P)-dependent dehydrogenase (short-subunit alcohol dehydrogenase family)